ncbi:MAG: hypothetical protein U0869_26340 [Chloroflexota bacterium]
MPFLRGLVGALGLAAVLAASAPAASRASFPGRNGDLVVFTQLGFSSSLHVVTPGGRLRRTFDAFMTPSDFRAAPDGHHLAYEEEDGAWVSDLAGVHRRRVVRGARQPTWGPDGRHLAYVRDGSVWTVGLDGHGARRVTSPWGGHPSGWGGRDTDPSWSPDGRSIAFVRERLAGPRCRARRDLYVVDLRARRTRRLFRPALRCATVQLPDWSPDGRRLVVVAGQDPALHENVDPRGSALGGTTILDADGRHARRICLLCGAAVWSPDGRHLAFAAGHPTSGGPPEEALHLLSPRDGRHRTIATFSASGAGTPVWLVRPPRTTAGSAAGGRSHASTAGLPVITRPVGIPACLAIRGSGEPRCTPLRAPAGHSGFAADLSDEAVSPDGRSVYVTVLGAGRGVHAGRPGRAVRASALLVLRRDPATGALRQLPGASGCLAQVRAPGCATARGIDGAGTVLVSPDSRYVYVAGWHSRGLAIFRRDPSGRLRQPAGTAGCLRDRARGAREACRYADLNGDDDLSMSPDGRELYGFGRVLRRDPRTGTVTVTARTSVSAPHVTPDGRFAYALQGDTSTAGSGILGFRRQPTTGSLEPLPGSARCTDVSRTDGCRRYGSQAQSLSIAPDGRTLEVALGVQDRVVTFLIDAQTGALHPVQSTATCPGRSAGNACPLDDGGGLQGTAIAPDGLVDYAILDSTVVAYARSLSDGTLSPSPWPGGCLTVKPGDSGCPGGLPGVGAMEGLISPDGRQLYLLGLSDLSVLLLG